MTPVASPTKKRVKLIKEKTLVELSKEPAKLFLNIFLPSSWNWEIVGQRRVQPGRTLT